MPSQQNDYQDHVDETTCYAIASEADAQVFQLLSENSSSDLQLLIARLAYAEYAVEKQEFIQFYKESHQQLPSDQIVGAVISTFQVRNSSRLKQLQERVSTDLQKLIRKSAEALILSEYAAPLKSILDQNTQSLTSELKELIAQNTEAIQSEVKQGTQFKTAVWAGIVASFWYTVIVAFVILSKDVLSPDNKFSRILRILLE